MSAPADFDIEGYAYRFPLWHPGGDEDDCAAFLLYVRPRLPGIAARYEDWGKPFTAYLGACLRYQWMSYLRRKYRERDQREADTRIGTTLMLTTAAEPPDPSWEARTIDRDSTRRQIVAAAIKACCELDDMQIAVLAESTGRPDLPALIERGRQCVKTTARAEQLRKRMARGLSAKLAGRDNQNARAYRNAAVELRRCRLAPSNSQVAEILGVPKGTVDTWMYWLRRSDVAKEACAEPKAA